MSKLVLRRASSFKTRTQVWLWENRIPLGELTLVAGREGAGKGLLMSYLIAAITRGKLKGANLGQPRSVAVVAHEDSWEKTIAPRLRVAGADLRKVFHISVQDEDGRRKLTIPDDLPLIANIAQSESDVVMLALDPLMSTIDGTVDLYKSPQVRPVLEAFRNALERANIAGLGIVHFNKTSDGDVLSKIANSRAIVEVARAALVVAEDKEAPGTMIMSQPRNNLGRTDLPNLAFEKIGVDFTAHDGGTSSQGRLKWTSFDYHISASDAMETKSQRKAAPTQLDIVVEWMAEGATPVTAAEVAEGTGIDVAKVRVQFQRGVEKGRLRKLETGKYVVLRP